MPSHPQRGGAPERPLAWPLRAWVCLLVALLCACTSGSPGTTPESSAPSAPALVPAATPAPRSTPSPSTPPPAPRRTRAQRPRSVPVAARVEVTALPSVPHRQLRQRDPYRVVDPDVHLDVAVPQVSGQPVLNRRLRSVANASVRSFRRTLRREGGSGPRRYHAMTVGWQLLGESSRAIGIQLWVAQQHGLRATIHPVTVWYDPTTRTVLALRDLFHPSAWPAVSRAVTRVASPRYRSAAVPALTANGPPEGKGPTFGFTADGDLAITFPARVLSSRRPVTVRLAGPPLTSRLSPAGRSASSAAQARRTPTPKRARTDCTRKKCVALTFDDGPGSFTAELVALLRQRDVPATFFVLGDRVQQSAGLLATVNAAGMEIGNHSMSHRELPFLEARELKRDLKATSQVINAVTGRRTTLLRPPYGSRNATVDAVSEKLGLAEVLWDVDTLDWRYPDSRRVRRAAGRLARRGSIILLHDVHRTTVGGVPGIIADLRRRGFTFVTVSELLHPRPVPGQIYRQQRDAGRR